MNSDESMVDLGGGMVVPLRELIEDDYEDPDDECTICGGDGYTECDDPIQCCSRHLGNDWDQFCECRACGGTGRAKDQTIW